MSFAASVNDFNAGLSLDVILPEGIGVMNPFLHEETRDISRRFYDKYYNDERKRIFLFGINPGRFGAGITGICFTDPLKLEKNCGIPNPFQKKPELSSDFIYTMIAAFGGPERYYSSFYITALSPLGFVQDGKNLNYYDNKELLKAVQPFMEESIEKQLCFGTTQEVAFCIGEGENFRFFQKLNEKNGYFKDIRPLPHPRFIMQYRRKKLDSYIADYQREMEAALKYLS